MDDHAPYGRTEIPFSVTLQPNGVPCHSCAGQKSTFVECLEMLDSRLRGSDTISAFSGENQRGPPFG